MLASSPSSSDPSSWALRPVPGVAFFCWYRYRDRRIPCLCWKLVLETGKSKGKRTIRRRAYCEVIARSAMRDGNASSEFCQSGQAGNVLGRSGVPCSIRRNRTTTDATKDAYVLAAIAGAAANGIGRIGCMSLCLHDVALQSLLPAKAFGSIASTERYHFPIEPATLTLSCLSTGSIFSTPFFLDCVYHPRHVLRVVHIQYSSDIHSSAQTSQQIAKMADKNHPSAKAPAKTVVCPSSPHCWLAQAESARRASCVVPGEERSIPCSADV